MSVEKIKISKVDFDEYYQIINDVKDIQKSEEKEEEEEQFLTEEELQHDKTMHEELDKQIPEDKE